MLAETDSERPANVGSEEPGHRADREAGGMTKRVLLVDDHDLFRQVLAVVLERHAGLEENLQAGSTAEARVVAGEHNGDELTLAIVDLDLPDEDVFDLIGELRGRGVPVLAITANGNLKQSAWASEADEVLTTASSSNDILGAARRLIGG